MEPRKPMGERGKRLPGADILHAGLGVTAAVGLAWELAGIGDPRPWLAASATLAAARFAAHLARGSFTVDLLMAIVGLATLAHALVLEGLAVMALYAGAEALEEAVEAIARRRVKRLASMIPSYVAVVEGGRVRVVRVDDLEPGMTVIVRVGEAVPADSVALDTGALDLSLVTGEPHPVKVGPGAHVPSGAVVLEGPVRVRVVAPPSESYTQRLVRAAMEALESKPRTVRLLERLAPHFTAAALSAAAVLYLVEGVRGAVVALLVGCPSAFIVSSAYTASMAAAMLARRGVVLSGLDVLERLWRYDVVVLDKTGTLTRLRAEPLGDPEPRLLEAVAGAAAASRHPVARAIAALHPNPRAVAVREVRGRGLAGEVQITPGPPHPCGKTVLARVNGAEIAVCLREEPAEGAAELVAWLRRRGVRVIIASGDSPRNVERIASMLGVTEYYGGMDPSGKAALVRRLKASGYRVVYAGDGVNDVEALAAADVGVAVGDVDFVRGVADAVTVSGARGLHRLLALGRSHKAALAAAFAAAATVKMVAATLGVAAEASLPLVAVLGDDGSTLAAVLASTMVLAASAGRAGGSTN